MGGKMQGISLTSPCVRASRQGLPGPISLCPIKDRLCTQWVALGYAAAFQHTAPEPGQLPQP